MFAAEIGIDLGSANTVVVAKRRGIIAKEPSVVAVHRVTKAVVAVGNEARNMIGRTPENIVPIRPVRGGVISDMGHSTALLQHMIRQIAGSRWLKPRLVLTAQTGANAVDKRALADAALQAGAGEVSLVDEAVAAALGAGLPVESPVGSLLVHVGSGRTNVAVLSLGAVVVSASCEAAGDLLDEMVARHLKKEHGLLIGALTAERMKIELGSAMPGRSDSAKVTGRLNTTGGPAAVEVRAAEIHAAITDTIGQIADTVVSVLGLTPPELLADISRGGLTLTGGGALLDGLDRRLAQVTGLPVRLAEAPTDAVALGTAQLLEKQSYIAIMKVKK